MNIVKKNVETRQPKFTFFMFGMAAGLIMYHLIIGNNDKEK